MVAFSGRVSLLGFDLERLGELQFIAELVAHAKFTVAPRLSVDSLRNCRAGTLQFGIELVNVECEDVVADR